MAGCKSSEVIEESPESVIENSDEVKQDEAENPTPEASESEEKNPVKEVVLTINGMVKYRFTNDGKSWQGFLTQFDSNNPETRKIVRLIEIEPKLGWEDFELMTDHLNIYELPDQKEIENRKAGPITDISRAYELSVMNEDMDRSYSYFNPEGELAEHWQSRNVVIYGTYLINEFEVVQ